MMRADDLAMVKRGFSVFGAVVVMTAVEIVLRLVLAGVMLGFRHAP